MYSSHVGFLVFELVQEESSRILQTKTVTGFIAVKKDHSVPSTVTPPWLRRWRSEGNALLKEQPYKSRAARCQQLKVKRQMKSAALAGVGNMRKQRPLL